MDLIIYAHPDNRGSHNAAVLRRVRSSLDAYGRAHETIDLYADAFEPLLSGAEYAASASKQPAPADTLVEGYRARIARAERLIFIYPVWWYGAPAMLKGFFDRVFTPGFAYNFKKMPALPGPIKALLPPLCGVGVCYPLFLSAMPVEKRLKGKSAVVINTYGGGAEGFTLFGRAPEFAVDKAVLEFCGVSPVRRVDWWEARGPADQVPAEVARRIDEALRP